MANTRYDVHPTFGYVAVDLAALGVQLGTPPMRVHDVLQACEALGMRYHQFNLVRVARQCLGIRYRMPAGRSARPRTFDCSSLMVFVYAHAGLWLPRYTHLIVDHGNPVCTPYQPGDLLFTTGQRAWRHSAYPKGIGHVALVTSPTTCVHTENITTKRVVEVPIAQLQWPITVAKRLLDDVHACSVVHLPRHLLWVQHPSEIEALVRKHLQAHHRPRSH